MILFSVFCSLFLYNCLKRNVLAIVGCLTLAIWPFYIKCFFFYFFKFFCGFLGSCIHGKWLFCLSFFFLFILLHVVKDLQQVVKWFSWRVFKFSLLNARWFIFYIFLSLFWLKKNWRSSKGNDFVSFSSGNYFFFKFIDLLL